MVPVAVFYNEFLDTFSELTAYKLSIYALTLLVELDVAAEPKKSPNSSLSSPDAASLTSEASVLERSRSFG